MGCGDLQGQHARVTAQREIELDECAASGEDIAAPSRTNSHCGMRIRTGFARTGANGCESRWLTKRQVVGSSPVARCAPPARSVIRHALDATDSLPSAPSV